MGRIYWVVRGVPERHREKQRRKERSRERSREGKRENEREKSAYHFCCNSAWETGWDRSFSRPFFTISWHSKTTEVGKDTSHCQLNIILQYLYYHISSINRPGPLIFSEAPHPGLLLEQGPLFFPHQFSGIPVIDIHNTTLLINNTSSSLVVSK